MHRARSISHGAAGSPQAGLVPPLQRGADCRAEATGYGKWPPRRCGARCCSRRQTQEGLGAPRAPRGRERASRSRRVASVRAAARPALDGPTRPTAMPWEGGVPTTGQHSVPAGPRRPPRGRWAGPSTQRPLRSPNPRKARPLKGAEPPAAPPFPAAGAQEKSAEGGTLTAPDRAASGFPGPPPESDTVSPKSEDASPGPPATVR